MSDACTTCPWHNVPDVIIHAPETAVKQHDAYAGAKAGDDEAAHALVVDTLSTDAVQRFLDLVGVEQPFLASATRSKETA